MSANINPAAPHHLPGFITAPGESDVLLNGAAVFLVVLVLMLGSVYFRLHALPEHMAHKNANKLQFEVVAILALLALHSQQFVLGCIPAFGACSNTRLPWAVGDHRPIACQNGGLSPADAIRRA